MDIEAKPLYTLFSLVFALFVPSNSACCVSEGNDGDKRGGMGRRLQIQSRASVPWLITD